MKQSKYQPLQDFLLNENKDKYQLNFKQIEDIIHDTLPKSASTHQAWWANEDPATTSHSHSKSWTQAGYKTENVNLIHKKVEFIKT